MDREYRELFRDLVMGLEELSWSEPGEDWSNCRLLASERLQEGEASFLIRPFYCGEVSQDDEEAVLAIDITNRKIQPLFFGLDNGSDKYILLDLPPTTLRLSSSFKEKFFTDQYELGEWLQSHFPSLVDPEEKLFCLPRVMGIREFGIPIMTSRFCYADGITFAEDILSRLSNYNEIDDSYTMVAEGIKNYIRASRQYKMESIEDGLHIRMIDSEGKELSIQIYTDSNYVDLKIIDGSREMYIDMKFDEFYESSEGLEMDEYKRELSNAEKLVLKQIPSFCYRRRGCQLWCEQDQQGRDHGIVEIEFGQQGVIKYEIRGNENLVEVSSNYLKMKDEYTNILREWSENTFEAMGDESVSLKWVALREDLVKHVSRFIEDVVKSEKQAFWEIE